MHSTAAPASSSSPPLSPAAGHKGAASNPLSEWYQAQRNPYAARNSTVAATLSPLHLHLLALKRQQQMRSLGKGPSQGQSQPLKQQQQSPRQPQSPPQQQSKQQSQQREQRVQPSKGARLRPDGQPPSLMSLVLALFRWCSVIWGRKAGADAASTRA